MKETKQNIKIERVFKSRVPYLPYVIHHASIQKISKAMA